jgi:hypothetical protein
MKDSQTGCKTLKKINQSIQHGHFGLPFGVDEMAKIPKSDQSQNTSRKYKSEK